LLYLDNSTTSLPIQFEAPVYGSNTPTFTEFMAPGVILSITYFMAVGLTSISFIIERRDNQLSFIKFLVLFPNVLYGGRKM
jgi:hypothetical protein